jgi:hypothetical protein
MDTSHAASEFPKFQHLGNAICKDGGKGLEGGN